MNEAKSRIKKMDNKTKFHRNGGEVWIGGKKWDRHFMYSYCSIKRYHMCVFLKETYRHQPAGLKEWIINERHTEWHSKKRKKQKTQIPNNENNKKLIYNNTEAEKDQQKRCKIRATLINERMTRNNVEKAHNAHYRLKKRK